MHIIHPSQALPLLSSTGEYDRIESPALVFDDYLPYYTREYTTLSGVSYHLLYRGSAVDLLV